VATPAAIKRKPTPISVLPAAVIGPVFGFGLDCWPDAVCASTPASDLDGTAACSLADCIIALNGMGSCAAVFRELRNIPAHINGTAKDLIDDPITIEYCLFIHNSFVLDVVVQFV